MILNEVQSRRYKIKYWTFFLLSPNLAFVTFTSSTALEHMVMGKIIIIIMMIGHCLETSATRAAGGQKNAGRKKRFYVYCLFLLRVDANVRRLHLAWAQHDEDPKDQGPTTTALEPPLKFQDCSFFDNQWHPQRLLHRTRQVAEGWYVVFRVRVRKECCAVIAASRSHNLSLMRPESN
jgi:hypothetical protein